MIIALPLLEVAGPGNTTSAYTPSTFVCDTLCPTGGGVGSKIHGTCSTAAESGGPSVFIEGVRRAHLTGRLPSGILVSPSLAGLADPWCSTIHSEIAAGACGRSTCGVSCGAEITGRFCVRCGEQQLDPELRALSHLARDFIEGLTSVDGKLMRTLQYLFLKPGQLDFDYHIGKRNSLYKADYTFLTDKRFLRKLRIHY